MSFVLAIMVRLATAVLEWQLHVVLATCKWSLVGNCCILPYPGVATASLSWSSVLLLCGILLCGGEGCMMIFIMWYLYDAG